MKAKMGLVVGRFFFPPPKLWYALFQLLEPCFLPSFYGLFYKR